MAARRTAALAAGSAIAVVGLVVSVGWGPAQDWADTHPVQVAAVDSDGSATIGDFTLRFEGIEEISGLESSYGDRFDPPPGWRLWSASFEVASDAGEDAPVVSTTTVVEASDGASYTRSDLISFDVAPDDGWLGDFGLEAGSFDDVVLLPDGVLPERVRVVPTLEARDYWAFDV